eukprot:c15457_g1_i1.p1 GENE.c15457_g1_i1~~c15457_g1_i1.p1  ORF type:complete len:200 (+),score=69.34 c15457_g1_i1:50-601(+)
MAARKPRLLVAVTGSMVIQKSLLKNFLQTYSAWATVRLIFTDRAFNSVSKSDDKIENTESVFKDSDEWKRKQKGEKPLHLELISWADAFVIAPLSANKLSKIINGVSDSLMISIARAWDFQKPLVIVPLMSKEMWEHPMTSKQVHEVESWGVVSINPQEETFDDPLNVLDISQKIQDAIRQFG